MNLPSKARMHKMVTTVVSEKEWQTQEKAER